MINYEDENLDEQENNQNVAEESESESEDGEFRSLS